MKKMYFLSSIIIASFITILFMKNVVGVFATSPLTPPTTPPTTPPVVTTTTPPTPTPKPKENRPPRILPESSHLPNGKVFKFYWANIKIIDPDHDRVWANISGLPKGLNKNCISFLNSGRCYIFGLPKQKGEFEIKVKAWDSQNAITQKSYILVIK